MKHIVLHIGPNPPPIHGASYIHSSMGKAISEMGLDFISLDTSLDIVQARNPQNTLHKFFARIFCFFKYLNHLLVARSVYLTLSGGFLGSAFDAFVVLIAVLAKVPVFVHHHSYSYINKSSIWMYFIVLLGHSRVHHIFLGDLMKKDFFSRYSPVPSTCISNLAFLPPDKSNLLDSKHQSETSTLYIGHFSNLSYEKGSHHFINVAQSALEQNKNWKFILAGPLSSELMLSHGDIIRKLPNLSYLGPLDFTQKQKFYNSIDIFLFLSMYKHEAAPLVLYEAISFGVLPVSTSLGMILQCLTTIQIFYFQGVRQLQQWYLSILKICVHLIKLTFISVNYFLKAPRLRIYLSFLLLKLSKTFKS